MQQGRKRGYTLCRELISHPKGSQRSQQRNTMTRLQRPPMEHTVG